MAKIKTVEFKFSLGTMGDFIPSLSEIKTNIFGIGNSIFSAKRIFRAVYKIFSFYRRSKGFKKSMSIIAGSFSTISKGIGWTVQMIANLNGKFSELFANYWQLLLYGMEYFKRQIIRYNLLLLE